MQIRRLLRLNRTRTQHAKQKSRKFPTHRALLQPDLSRPGCSIETIYFRCRAHTNLALAACQFPRFTRFDFPIDRLSGAAVLFWSNF
jgi:hypothetical protein